MMGLFLLIFFKSSASHIQELPIPKVVYDSIKTLYSFDQTELEPEMADLVMELKTKKNNVKLPLGYTQETVDLAQYIKKTDTSFNFKLVNPYKIVDKNTNMYFISRYKPLKSVSGRIYGYPCGTVLRLNSHVGEILNTEGLKVSTFENQYVRALGGDYIVLHKDDKKMKISYFRVRDTRWTQEMCNLNNQSI